MLVAGVALLAVPLLLTLQFAELSNRPAELLDEALKGSLYPANLATLAVANIFGTHGKLLGPERRLAARRRPHRRLVQLSVRRLAAADPAAVARHRRRRRLATGAAADRRDARSSHCCSCSAATRRCLRLPSPTCPASTCSAGRRMRASCFSAALALLCGHLLADYRPQRFAEAARPRRGARGARLSSPSATAIEFSARSGHATSRVDRGGQGRRHPARWPSPRSRLASTARAQRVVATALAVVAVAELMWWNTAFRLNAEPRANYAVLEQPTGADAERHRHPRPRDCSATARAANVRASKSPASAAPGRTWRWCAAGRRSTATIRCGSATTTASSRRAKATGAPTCGSFRSRSAATTARSRARSA